MDEPSVVGMEARSRCRNAQVVLRAERLSAESFAATLRDLLVELDLHGCVSAYWEHWLSLAPTELRKIMNNALKGSAVDRIESNSSPAPDMGLERSAFLASLWH